MTKDITLTINGLNTSLTVTSWASPYQEDAAIKDALMRDAERLIDGWLATEHAFEDSLKDYAQREAERRTVAGTTAFTDWLNTVSAKSTSSISPNL